ncbi:hypothetical protein P7K49_028012 [Saguinus oedipus]|uniref:Uncharacterized protein n=1 Tax=Saguinus oedipus TaxID=9490 RepID=A0ABQ9UB37_SAGOE|nr:hypothetical protein P7K49_028012 [Saguinus oedipus]
MKVVRSVDWEEDGTFVPFLPLNVIRKLIADEVDFLQHVTQLDLRDNKLGDLDAMIFNNIEGSSKKEKINNEKIKMSVSMSRALNPELFAKQPRDNFCCLSLRKLLAGHNQLARLPERLERTSVEVLDVQHNQLQELPPNLLMKADR